MISHTSESHQEGPFGLFRDTSGKYRWIYELPMRKSFFLLFEVWKVLASAAGVVFIFSVIVNLCSGNGISSIPASLVSVFIPLGILFVLSFPAYYIVTRANNGMYTVLFEMDDSGIDHIQIKTEKAKALDLLTVFVGATVRNRTTTAAGLLSAAGASLYSRFAKVWRIRIDPSRHMIALDGILMRNQVYVNEEAFGFVCDYILAHCPEATVRRKA